MRALLGLGWQRAHRRRAGDDRAGRRLLPLDGALARGRPAGRRGGPPGRRLAGARCWPGRHGRPTWPSPRRTGCPGGGGLPAGRRARRPPAGHPGAPAACDRPSDRRPACRARRLEPPAEQTPLRADLVARAAGSRASRSPAPSTCWPTPATPSRGSRGRRPARSSPAWSPRSSAPASRSRGWRSWSARSTTAASATRAGSAGLPLVGRALALLAQDGLLRGAYLEDFLTGGARRARRAHLRRPAHPGVATTRCRGCPPARTSGCRHGLRPVAPPAGAAALGPADVRRRPRRLPGARAVRASAAIPFFFQPVRQRTPGRHGELGRRRPAVELPGRACSTAATASTHAGRPSASG